MFKVVSVVMLTSLFVGTLTLTANVSIVEGESGVIYIRPDGTVEPPTPQIQRNGNIYTFVGDIINKTIVLEKDNIVIDGNGHTFNGTWYQRRGFVLDGRRNVTIKNVHITHFWLYGIDLHLSSDSFFLDNNLTASDINLDTCAHNVFSGNTIRYAFEAFKLEGGSNNQFIKNTVTNSYCGVFQYYGHSTFYKNTFSNNSKAIWTVRTRSTLSCNKIVNNSKGIAQQEGHNIIVGNLIANNSYGISLLYTSGNMIYHNNFINNTQQVDIQPSDYPNVWDNGYPSGGNYWSDYAGVDLLRAVYQNETGSDGIGDTPYVISADCCSLLNWDNYPLMKPWSSLSGDINRDEIVNIEDIVISALAFGSYPEHPKWNPQADLDNNGLIDIIDLVIIGVNFGKKW